MANISISNGAITVKQGTTCSWAYVLKNGVNAVDITGATCAMQVRASYDSKTPLLTLTTANGKISNGGVNGTFTLTLAPADTTAVKVTGEALEGVYDVEVTDAGVVTRIAEGSFTISREVTV